MMVFALLWVSMVLGVSAVGFLVLEVLRDNWFQTARVPANRRRPVWEDDLTIVRNFGPASRREWSGFMPAAAYATMNLFWDLGYKVSGVKSTVFRERSDAG
jgi:hypothetical protein